MMQAVLGVADPYEREKLRQCLVEEGFAAAIPEDPFEILDDYKRLKPRLLIVDLDWFVADFSAFLSGRQQANCPYVLLLVPFDEQARATHYLLLGGDDLVFKDGAVEHFRFKLQQFKQLAGLRRRLDALRLGRLPEEAVLAASVRQYSRNIKHLFCPSSLHSSNFFLVGHALNGNQFVLAGDLSRSHAAPGQVAACLAETYFDQLRRTDSFCGLLNHLDTAVDVHLPDAEVPVMLLELDPSCRRLRWWNGGMPEAFLWREKTGDLHPLAQRHRPLGPGAHGTTWGAEDVSDIALQPDDRLYSYTESLLAVCGNQGGESGAPELRAHLMSTPSNRRFDSMGKLLSAYLANRKLEGDVHFAEIAPFDRRGSTRRAVH